MVLPERGSRVISPPVGRAEFHGRAQVPRRPRHAAEIFTGRRVDRVDGSPATSRVLWAIPSEGGDPVAIADEQDIYTHGNWQPH